MRNPLLGFKEKLEAFEIVTLRLVGLFPLHCVRVWALRAFGADVSRDAVVYHGFLVRAARGLRIGKRCNVGEGAVLDGRGGLVRGDDVNLSSDVHIWTAQHDWNSRDFAHVRASVEIECRVWLGPRVTVLPGASIGEGDSAVSCEYVCSVDRPCG